MKWFCTLLFLASTITTFAQSSGNKPLQVGVVGLTHSHVHWILGREDQGDIEIVGIVEPNQELARALFFQYNLPLDLLYDDLETMLDETQPEAVTAFNTIYGHLNVVEICAPRGIHVMVEKPLAVSWNHAQQMAELARQHNIHLLTNYETTWYGSNHEAYRLVHEENAIGDLRKIVVHDGHPGPKEIGVNKEFLDWLTDPKWNGAGALTDFGCYGANLITWLMRGERPTSVTAVTQQIKPDIYPKVDDEATIIVTYPKTQGVIQASWNWPVSRKDMEVYGKTGYVHALNATDMRFRPREKESEQLLKAQPRENPRDDPFAYLAGVVRGTIEVHPTDLSALENNLVVMEILDAAIRSAKSGKTIELE